MLGWQVEEAERTVLDQSAVKERQGLGKSNYVVTEQRRQLGFIDWPQHDDQSNLTESSSMHLTKAELSLETRTLFSRSQNLHKTFHIC
jgi:hypothetical protein